MSAPAWGERLRIAAITATLTSAAWILFGSGVMQSVGGGIAVFRKTENSAPPRPATKILATGAQAAPSTPPPIISGDYQLPVAGVRPDQLTDTFTAARGGGTRVHEALDIMASRGTPVLAAVPGTVEKLFLSKLGGNTIYVRSPDRRIITYYAHLDRYAPGLAENQQVRRGQQIGFVGSTGDASPDAPHLHFAILAVRPDKGWWQSDRAINPYPILTGKTREASARR